MAKKITWSPQAILDVDEVISFISIDSEERAFEFAEKIFQAARSLENHAERGRRAPEFKNQAIRELFLKNHRIIYRIEDAGVEILRVIHGMRLPLN